MLKIKFYLHFIVRIRNEDDYYMLLCCF